MVTKFRDIVSGSGIEYDYYGELDSDTNYTGDVEGESLSGGSIDTSEVLIFFTSPAYNWHTYNYSCNAYVLNMQTT
jgi:hypothetical protein